MEVETYVNPETAIYLNAIFFAFFCFPFIFMPFEVCRGGPYQGQWFKNMPVSRSHRNYWWIQGCGIGLFVTAVVSAFILPNSQLLCYQLATVHALFFLHMQYYFFAPKDSVYGKSRVEGKDLHEAYFYVYCVFLPVMVVTILACGHPDTYAVTPVVMHAAVQQGRIEALLGSIPLAIREALKAVGPLAQTIVATRTANIVAICCGSFFGLGLAVFPRAFISQWFVDVDDAAEAKREYAEATGNGGADIELAGVGASAGASGGNAGVNVSAVPSASPNTRGRKTYQPGDGAGAGKTTFGPSRFRRALSHIRVWAPTLTGPSTPQIGSQRPLN